MTDAITYEAPSWRQIQQMLLNQALKIQKSVFTPDVIVGICRGGWIPARLLSDFLGNSNLANVKAENYLGIAQAKRAATLTQPLSAGVSGKRVLVVDDVADSGKSLKLVHAHVLERGAAEVKVATIYYKLCCPYKPDFYEKETSSWIVFPWELKETLTEISASKSGLALDAELQKLAEAGVPKRLIACLMKEFKGRC